MRYETGSGFQVEPADDESRRQVRAHPARVIGTLPAGRVMIERVTGILRAELVRRGLRGYRILWGSELDVNDIERHLDALGETRAHWQPFPPLVRAGEQPQLLTKDGPRVDLHGVGLLWLRRHRVLLARCDWFDTDCDTPQTLWLCAARSVESYQRLHARLLVIRRESGHAAWQVLSGGYGDPAQLPRPRVAASDLYLTDAVRSRLDAEVLGFFGDSVAKLYASLRVPYRRGVLMHGPPGNGKTSMIRFIGGALPSIPAMILRPEASFDDDDMKQIVRRWSEQAPAILVIEDLDWLLDKRVNVSIFLNLIDGIDASVTGGLLLIATTNHPETLDPAINNRPGRFDVVIEVDVPTPELRGRFLRDKLEDASMAEAILDRLVDRTDGLSFAHLQEILRLSGMLAIRDGRSQRSDEDLLRAADLAVEGHEAAIRGYPPGRPVMPFGLAQLRKARPCMD